MKSKLFKRAWELVKTLSIKFAKCLVLAWQEAKGYYTNLNTATLTALLRANVGTLTFIKKDGSLSTHKATKVMAHVPTNLQPKGNSSSDKVVTFFSLTANEWRCISLSSLPTATFTI